MNLEELQGGLDKPELYFGIVAAVGTACKWVESDLAAELLNCGYTTEAISLSEQSKAFALATPYPNTGASEFDRISQLTRRCDELREVTKKSEVLALLAAGVVAAKRPTVGQKHLNGRAFIFRQVKHPDEVLWLRHTYGNAFHLLGLHSSRNTRRNWLKDSFTMPGELADGLIEKDELGSGPTWGHQLRKTFHLADFFVQMRDDAQSTDYVKEQIKRFVDVLFGRRMITPTRQEHGMFLAHAAALRSADLSRQVGASILDAHSDLMSIGGNEVPRATGGQYWGEDTSDERDFKYHGGADWNERKRIEALKEILESSDPKWVGLDAGGKKERLRKLELTRVANLIEFGRPVHAEMEAILSAARHGVSVRGASLYTTTFPCHNCAKHIVGAGIVEVFFIEPYPKSLASELHADSLVLVEDPADNDASVRVKLRPFVGVAPRRYSALFSIVSEQGKKWRRKDDDGNFALESGLRLRGASLSHSDREENARKASKDLPNVKQAVPQ
jgi:deoxycytidylate deaminase